MIAELIRLFIILAGAIGFIALIAGLVFITWFVKEVIYALIEKGVLFESVSMNYIKGD